MAIDSDPDRFVNAQDHEGAYERALSEIRSGHKRTHWMWFIFPQIAGLGAGPMSVRYAISSLDEAQEYLAHPILGVRLLECTESIAAVAGRSADQILGATDALKLCSSMTLFHSANPKYLVFQAVLDRYFDGEFDHMTRALLASR